jgi:hypothetical protein
LVTPGAGDLWPAIGKTTSTESVFGRGDEGRQPVLWPRSVASVALYISHDADLWNRVDTSDIGEGGAGEVDAITATPTTADDLRVATLVAADLVEYSIDDGGGDRNLRPPSSLHPAAIERGQRPRCGRRASSRCRSGDGWTSFASTLAQCS